MSIMEKSPLVRSNYYSFTEVIKKYKISIVKYHALLKEKNIPFESVHIDFGTYQMNTIYVLKTTIDSLQLPLRV